MATLFIPTPKTIRSNLTGREFGRLLVLGFHRRNGNEMLWACECSCGNESIVSASSLRRGQTTSCGCYAREASASRLRTHGKARTGTYRSWQAMWTRCTNPRHQGYPDYGGRGITVCEKWATFEPFLKDMGIRPFGNSIGRIDNDGNYEPGNCRWEGVRQQANNRRSSHWMMFDGERLTVEQVAEKIGMNTHTLRSRLKMGIPENIATSVPVFRGLQSLSTV